jgi:hypothetical protein
VPPPRLGLGTLSLRGICSSQLSYGGETVFLLGTARNLPPPLYDIGSFFVIRESGPLCHAKEGEDRVYHHPGNIHYKKAYGNSGNNALALALQVWPARGNKNVESSYQDEKSCYKRNDSKACWRREYKKVNNASDEFEDVAEPAWGSIWCAALNKARVSSQGRGSKK